MCAVCSSLFGLAPYCKLNPAVTVKKKKWTQFPKYEPSECSKNCETKWMLHCYHRLSQQRRKEMEEGVQSLIASLPNYLPAKCSGSFCLVENKGETLTFSFWLLTCHEESLSLSFECKCWWKGVLIVLLGTLLRVGERWLERNWKKERKTLLFLRRVLFQMDIGQVTFQTKRICERGKSVLCTGLWDNPMEWQMPTTWVSQMAITVRNWHLGQILPHH
jgi:hypothetical protein